MNIGDRVVVMKAKIIKRGKKKMVKSFSGVISDFKGTIGFYDDELVYNVIDDSGLHHEIQQSLLKKEICTLH